MGLESSFNYPSDLNSSWPAAGDDPVQGDDHLRGIKSVFKTTLPNVTGAITATQDELNLVDGSSAGTVVNSKAVIYDSSGGVSCNNLNFNGNARRITGNFSDATQTNRVSFQTSTTNDSTIVSLLPNGSGTLSALNVYGNSDMSVSSIASLRCSGSTTSLRATRGSVSGTFGILEFYTSDTSRMWISEDGIVTITGNTLNVGTQKTPASASATGTKGDICHDTNYIYVCTATNTWKRAALSTW